jgi:hypothetical protein
VRVYPKGVVIPPSINRHPSPKKYASPAGTL